MHVCSPSSLLTIALLGGLSLLPSAQAQARFTANKDVGLSAFGEISRVNTDYGSTNAGGTLGFDATRFFRLVQPSLEVRGSFAPGQVVGEKTLLAGIKLEKRFGPFHPYALGQVGGGWITFTHPTGTLANGQPYTHDNSFVYNLGGGLDYDLHGNFAVKAEFTDQLWRLSDNLPRLTPTAFSVGVVYRIPFRGLHR